MSGKRPEWRRSLGLISVAIFAHENPGENGANIELETSRFKDAIRALTDPSLGPSNITDTGLLRVCAIDQYG